MRHSRPPGIAPDYTIAALTLLGVNAFWIFFVLWAAYGLVPVLLLAGFLNHLISRLAISRTGLRPG